VHNFTYAASTANKPHLFNLKIIIMKLLKTLLFLALFSISFSSCNDLEDDDNTQKRQKLLVMKWIYQTELKINLKKTFDRKLKAFFIFELKIF
jgi:hypothetical protein